MTQFSPCRSSTNAAPWERGQPGCLYAATQEGPCAFPPAAVAVLATGVCRETRRGIGDENRVARSPKYCWVQRAIPGRIPPRPLPRYSALPAGVSIPYHGLPCQHSGKPIPRREILSSFDHSPPSRDPRIPRNDARSAGCLTRLCGSQGGTPEGRKAPSGAPEPGAWKVPRGTLSPAVHPARWGTETRQDKDARRTSAGPGRPRERTAPKMDPPRPVPAGVRGRSHPRALSRGSAPGAPWQPEGRVHARSRYFGRRNPPVVRSRPGMV